MHKAYGDDRNKEMVKVEINQNHAQFAYDVQALIGAFYPGKTVRVVAVDTDTGMGIDAGADTAPASGKPVETVRIVFFKKAVRLYFGKREYAWDGQAGENYKDAFRAFFYASLCDFTGKSLPWGNLTGIRPAKIAMRMLEEGKGEEEIRDFLKRAHFVSREKADLSIQIAQRERKILSGIPYGGGYSLYIGIPFCPTTCLYCSFTSYPIRAWEMRVDAYLEALGKELSYVSRLCAGRMANSVYIGGGTPTTLLPKQLERLLAGLRDSFPMRGVQEFTVEAGRADSITREKLSVLKHCGVTRISVNPQTMKDETLKLIGRQHTVSQVVEAFWAARKEGFDNINMDLILGLPGETSVDVCHTLEEIKKLRPESITVHSLAIKRAAGLAGWMMQGGVETMRNTQETMALAAQAAADMDMLPYYLYRQKNMAGNFENVGYAREGKEGLYNILMMEEVQDIIACGPGSISKRVYPDGRIARCDNVKDVAQYIERIDEMIERKHQLFTLP